MNSMSWLAQMVAEARVPYGAIVRWSCGFGCVCGYAGPELAGRIAVTVDVGPPRHCSTSPTLTAPADGRTDVGVA